VFPGFVARVDDTPRLASDQAGRILFGVPHYARKRDLTEPAIVAALRQIGATVLINEHPDLIVGFRGQTFLFECKSPEKRNHKNLKTPSQVKLFEEWRGGPLHIVFSAAEALAIVTKERG